MQKMYFFLQNSYTFRPFVYYSFIFLGEKYIDKHPKISYNIFVHTIFIKIQNKRSYKT